MVTISFGSATNRFSQLNMVLLQHCFLIADRRKLDAAKTLKYKNTGFEDSINEELGRIFRPL